ncbi:MAG: stage II sporulation protein D [Candidatus Reconcilbacillus cellulovorans]|uniref:Stage II sporulation protein D n=1 Tax=Candidatus Reconcilbacillus cellulovorans TaxID=1906605 RepID=A0A2A6DZQ4_9BACL|nr:MAG: stage II sporulation protein D [Candidatus Reconcilbacillus cellulovorans]
MLEPMQWKKAIVGLGIAAFVGTVASGWLPRPVATDRMPVSGGPSAESAADLQVSQGPTISVWFSNRGELAALPLEQYVLGVVAAEMPAEFALEALKAQAIAARTYAARRLFYPEERSEDARRNGADVTDTVRDQAFVPRTFGDGGVYERAVKETAGLVLTYGGRPAVASYFSTSNGYTEDSEEYWGTSFPYLKSVPSPWDRRLSPAFKQTVRMAKVEVARRLGLTGPFSVAGRDAPKVLERTAGGRIKRIQLGGKMFTGREVREKLGLASADFAWRDAGQWIEWTTYGSGHGVGMSQWGAQGMALEGKSAFEILAYFYRGTQVSRV